MKRINSYFKKLILTIVLTLSVVLPFTFGNTIQAGNGTIMTISYNLYTKEDYEIIQSCMSWQDAIMTYGSYAWTAPKTGTSGVYTLNSTADLEYANACWDGSIADEEGSDDSVIYVDDACTITAKDYFGGYPFDLISANKIEYEWIRSGSARIISGVNSDIGQNPAKASRIKNSFSYPSDGSDLEIVIEAVATTNDGTGIWDAAVNIDASAFSDGNTGTPYYSTDALNAGASGVAPNASNKGRVGFTGMSGKDAALPTPLVIGAIGFTVASGKTEIKGGIVALGNANSGQTVFAASDESTGKGYVAANASKFNDNGFNISIKSDKNDNTKMKTVVAGTNDITSATSTTNVGGQNRTTYTATGITDTNLNLKLTPEEGTVSKISYSTGTSASAADAYNKLNSGTNIPSGSQTTGYSIPMSGVNPGSTVYVAYEVTATDGVSKAVYIVALTSATKKIAALTGLVLSSDADSTMPLKWGNSNSGPWTTTSKFNTNTTTYYVAVAKSATKITVTPSFDTTAFQTCEIRSGSQVHNSANSGSSYDINLSSSSGTQITVKMTAQDTTITKTYTINVSFLDDDTNMASKPIITIGGQSYTLNEKNANNEYVVNNVPYQTNGTGITIRPNLKTGQTCTIEGTSVTSGTSVNKTLTINGTQADTNRYAIVVTALAGNQETYYVVINTDAADSTKSVTSITVNYGGQDYVATLNSTTGEYEVNNVPYKTSNFTVKVVVPKPNLQTISINGANTGNNTASSSISFTPNGYAAVSQTVNVRITAQDGTSEVHVLKVNRLKANEDTKLQNLSIVDNQGIEIGTWNYSNQSYTVPGSLAHSVTSIVVTATLPNGSLSKVTINNGNVNPFTHTYTQASDETKAIAVKVTAENPTVTNTININVTRAGADDNLGFTITGTDQDGTPITFDPVNTSLSTVTKNTTDLAFEVTDVILQLIPTSSKTTIKINGEAYTAGSDYQATFDVTAKGTPQTKRIAITIQTEANPNGVTKYIQLTRAEADRDKNVTINATGENDTTPATPAKNGKTYTYTFNRTISGENYYLSAVLPTASKAKVYTSTDNNTWSSFNPSESHSIGEIGADGLPVEYKVYVKVVSQYGDEDVYTIISKFTDARETNANIINIAVDVAPTFAFSQTKYNYTGADQIVVPYATATAKITVTLDSARAGMQSISGLAFVQDSVNKNVYTATATLTANSINTFTIQAHAENPSVLGNPYTIDIKREAARTDDFIVGLTINAIDCFTANTQYFATEFTEYSNNGFAFVFPRTQGQATISVRVSDGATYVISSAAGVGGVTSSTSGNFRVSLSAGNKITITVNVSSEAAGSTGSPNYYTFDIYAADRNYNMSNISLLTEENGVDVDDVDGNTFNFNPATLSYTGVNKFVVPYSVDKIYIDATKAINSNFASITGNGLVTLTAGQSKRFNVVISSEYNGLNSSVGETKTYIIEIERKAADSTRTLDELKVIIGGEDKVTNFSSSSTGPYLVENIPDNINTATITFKKTSSLSVATLGDYTVSKGSVDGTYTHTFVWADNTETINITVTAEDGSSSTYKLRLSKKAIVRDSDASISNITATYSGTNYYPSPFNATNHAPTINLPATVGSLDFVVTPSSAQTSTVIVNGVDSNSQFNVTVAEGETKNVTINCRAEDGTMGTPYTVTITRAQRDGNANLASLSVNGTPIANFASTNTGPYTVKVGSATDAVITATLEKNTSSITSNDAATPQVLNVGDNRYQITAQAENGTTKTYTVIVVKDADTSLSSLEAIIDGSNKLENFTATTTSYTITVPFKNHDYVTFNWVAVGGNLVTVAVKDANGNTMTSTAKGYAIPAGATTEYIITITAASGAATDYHVFIERGAGQSGNVILTYEKEDGNQLDGLSTSIFEYEYVIPWSSGIYTFAPNITVSDGATPKWPSNRTMNHGKNEYKIIVESETGDEQEYKFIVYNVDTDVTIQDINVLDKQNGTDVLDVVTNDFVDYNETNQNYSLEVYWTTKNVYLDILANSNTSKIFVNGQLLTNPSYQLSVGVNTFTIYALSEYGQLNSNDTGSLAKSKVYTVTITRRTANNDATLKELSIEYIDDNGVTQVKKATAQELASQEFIIENIGDNVTSITIKAIPTVGSTNVTGAGQKTLKIYNVADGTGYTFPFTIDTESEGDPGQTAKLQYEVTISRGPVNLDDNNTINYIKVNTDLKVYLSKAGDACDEAFSPTKETYTYVIPYGASSVTIIANKLAVSPATIWIFEKDTTPVKREDGLYQFNITSNLHNQTKVYEVYVKSQTQIDSKHYFIELQFEAPSTDATLKTLTVDGQPVPGFNPQDTNGVYTVPMRPNGTTSVQIAASSNDPKAKISGIGVKALSVGRNTYVVTVTAENGDVSTYTINISRDYPDPYLSDLSIVGERLLDANDTNTEYDKDVKEYHAIVTFATIKATINTMVDNINNIVLMSNADVSTFTDLTKSFVVELNEGYNYFTIEVHSVEGKVSEYLLVIQRRGPASANTNISEITIQGMDSYGTIKPSIVEEGKPVEEFNKEYKNTDTNYGVYVVENKIRDLDIKVTPEKIKDPSGLGATYRIFNDKNLKVGENKVVILITAEDGETTRAVVVTVIREEMEFTVNQNATDFECTKDEDYKYTINLKNKRAADIKDYSKYIEFAEEDNLEVKVLSDTSKKDCSEVVVSVSDGSEERIVTFQLKTTASNFDFSLYLWIILGIALLLLIIILICVNRDKYGSILKKRKRVKE